MPTFTVKNAVKTADKPDRGYGPMQTIALTLQEYGQAGETAAEWYTKATTLVPSVGAQIEGDIEPTQYGAKFKKAKPAGGFAGGVRGRSPEQEKSITRMHSQSTAIAYVRLLRELGSESVKPEFALKDLRLIIDWFDRDALEGWKPKPPLPPAAQRSDVPSDVPAPPSGGPDALGGES